MNQRDDMESIVCEDPQQLIARLTLIDVLAEADEDVKNGRVAPIENMFHDLRNLLKS